MLKQLKISNFRGFEDEVTVRFAPITVLIGRNNAGKSSIIKFLLMLQQSINSDNIGFLITQGDRIDLGSLYQHKNTNSRKKYLKFSFSIEDKSSPRTALSSYLYNKEMSFNPKGIIYTTEANILYNQRDNFQGKEHKMILTVENQKLFERSGYIHQDSSFLDFSDEQQKDRNKYLSDKQQRDRNKNISEDLLAKIYAEEACLETLSYCIKEIKYISPVKEELEGVIDTRVSIPRKYVEKKGRYTIHHLLRIIKNDNSDLRNFILHHLEEILDIRGIEFKSLGRMSQCEAKNKKTGAKTSIDNFGFGVSQCMPILIQGAMMDSGSTLMVEQPEAQVHPTSQLSLGQFFADLWKRRGVGSIIETHSGNVLFRLRHLIRKEELNEEDVSVAFFDLDENKIVIKNLDIKKDGSFDPGLPMEFFGADVLEGLEMGAGQ